MKQWTAEYMWQWQERSSGSRGSRWAARDPGSIPPELHSTCRGVVREEGRSHLPPAPRRQPTGSLPFHGRDGKGKAGRWELKSERQVEPLISSRSSGHRGWSNTALHHCRGLWVPAETSGNVPCYLWLCLLPASKSIAIKKKKNTLCLLAMSFWRHSTGLRHCANAAPCEYQTG